MVSRGYIHNMTERNLGKCNGNEILIILKGRHSCKCLGDPWLDPTDRSPVVGRCAGDEEAIQKWKHKAGRGDRSAPMRVAFSRAHSVLCVRYVCNGAMG